MNIQVDSNHFALIGNHPQALQRLTDIPSASRFSLGLITEMIGALDTKLATNHGAAYFH